MIEPEKVPTRVVPTTATLPLETEPITIYLRREPLTRDQVIPQVFTVSAAANPLLQAVSPLLTLATQLQEQSEAPDLALLHPRLCNEIKAFEVRAQELHYRSPIILAARYLLCSFIDEIIEKSSWGKTSLWPQCSLLKTFHHEAWGGDRFFVILERSAEDPHLNIDLLELGYFCLSLGYEGRYYNAPRGQREVGQFIDQLYYWIMDERGEDTFKCPKMLPPPPSSKKWYGIFKQKKILVILAIGVFLTIALNLRKQIQLNHLAQPVTQQLEKALGTPNAGFGLSHDV